MPYSTFIKRPPFKDPTKGRIIGPAGEAIEIHANRNNIVIVDFPNDDGDPAHTVTYYMNGDDLSDDTVARQAHFIIQSLNAQEAGLAAITFGQVEQPKPPDQAQIDLTKKQLAYAIAARDGMTKFRNIPEEVQALADLKSAESAIASAAIDVAVK